MSTRRSFLLQAAGIAAGELAVTRPLHSLALPSPRMPFSAAADASGDWYDRPMRWAQVGFVEDDPGAYDLLFWLDYFKRTHCDAACLSAGGVVAFYPTQVPLHYRSRWLGSRDCFGDILAGCRRLGMNAVARTDAHACHDDVRQAHPDWIAVDQQGQPIRHPSDPDFWITCALGPYNFEFMTAVHREIMTLYRPDGIFTNRWSGSGMCFCVHCQSGFRSFSGLDLPRSANPQDPARRQYIVWRSQRLFDLWHLWNAVIQSINPRAAYIANAGGGALSDLDMKTIGEMAPTLFADRQARDGVMPPWANGKNGKEYRATMGSKPIVGIFSMGLEEKYRWKDSVQSGDEIRLWVADGIAHDLRPWFTKFNAKLIDRRWLPVVEELYTWHAANQDYLRNEVSLARVGLVYSQQTATFYGGENAHAKVEDHCLGFYQALVEARIPFQMVHDRLLGEQDLLHYRTLVLPNIAALSTSQCRQIEAFVERGGSVVATYETSMYDEWGVRRPELGLHALFGVSSNGTCQGPMLNSYLELQKGSVPHPLFADLQDAVRIINSVHQLVVTQTSADASTPLRVIPSYPDLPMEEVFPRSTSGQGGVFLRSLGRSRIVYFPGDIDRTFWEVLATDHAKLLRNAVLWATNEPAPIQSEGPGVLDISIWRQERSMTVHLVNLTNPMMMKAPLREIIPVEHHNIRVNVPEVARVRRARLLVAGREAKFTREGRSLRVEVGRIGIHEVVAFDLSPA